MSHIPEPEFTPNGPAYEGRLLDRAEEEVVDQGVAFDLRTLVSRRALRRQKVGPVETVAARRHTTRAVGRPCFS
jgi:hypothetical protein